MPFQLKVSGMGWPGRVMAILAVFIIAGAWGWALDSLFPSDPHPYMDSCVTVLILAAQLLSALKKWDCWIAWLLVNAAQTAMHISIGNIFMPIVSGLYLANGIWSLVSWTKRMKNE